MVKTSPQSHTWCQEAGRAPWSPSARRLETHKPKQEWRQHLGCLWLEPDQRWRQKRACCLYIAGDCPENKAWYEPVLSPNILWLVFGLSEFLVNLPEVGNPLLPEQHLNLRFSFALTGSILQLYVPLIPHTPTSLFPNIRQLACLSFCFSSSSTQAPTFQNSAHLLPIHQGSRTQKKGASTSETLRHLASNCASVILICFK